MNIELTKQDISRINKIKQIRGYTEVTAEFIVGSALKKYHDKILDERRFIRFKKKYLQDQLIAQKWLCYYCKKPISLKEATTDHIVPRSKGGDSSRENLVVACEPCNFNKDELTEEEYNSMLTAHLVV